MNNANKDKNRMYNLLFSIYCKIKDFIWNYGSYLTYLSFAFAIIGLLLTKLLCSTYLLLLVIPLFLISILGIIEGLKMFFRIHKSSKSI